MDLETYIYALVDPLTGQIRYVGKSDNPIKRLSYHMSHCRHTNSHKHKWLMSLKRRCLEPRLIILEQTSQEIWQNAEQRWIKHFTECGGRLTNGDTGGLGGRKPTEDVCQRISQSLKGHPVTEYNRQRVRDVSRKLSDDEVNKIRKLYANGAPQKHLADQFEVNQAAISRIVHNKSYSHIQYPYSDDGIYHIPATRKRYVSPEFREMTRRRFKGRKLSPERRAECTRRLLAIHEKPVSEETRRKMAEAKIGKKGNRGRFSADEVIEIRWLASTSQSYKNLAAQYNCNSSTIANIVKRKCYQWVLE